MHDSNSLYWQLMAKTKGHHTEEYGWMTRLYIFFVLLQLHMQQSRILTERHCEVLKCGDTPEILSVNMTDTKLANENK